MPAIASSPASRIVAHWESVGVANGAPTAARTQPVIGAGSVRVASVVASIRPIQLPRVMVAAAPDRTVPTKAESVTVAAAEVFQYTLQAFAAPPITTWALVNVSAPGPPVPTLKIQTSVAVPLSVSTTPAPIVVPAAEQYTPGGSTVETIGMTPVHTGFCASMAVKALLKSATT